MVTRVLAAGQEDEEIRDLEFYKRMNKTQVATQCYYHFKKFKTQRVAITNNKTNEY